MVKLNPDKVPQPLVYLIPMAEKWRSPDGYAEAVENASSEELEALAHCMDDVAYDNLFKWLAGPGADNPSNMSPEYVAFTDLYQAIDEARATLEQRQGQWVYSEDAEANKEKLMSLVKKELERLRKR